MKRYLLNILIGFDQLANTVTGGDPDETLSSRFGKRSGSNVIRKAIDTIFFWQPNHCEKSVEPDKGKDAVLK